MRPSIAQADAQLGFHWLDERGWPVSLPELVTLDDEPDRLPPTHLSALDDALIDIAGRFGELLGGGRLVETVEEQADLRTVHRVLDRLCHEYAAALPIVGVEADVRGGQIVGTAQLVAIRARMALGMAGPSPLAGALSDPSTGVRAGFGQLQWVDEAQPWRGARWVLQSEDGPRFPLTLAMILFDSSGVNKDAAVDEHRVALRTVADASDRGDAVDSRIATGAVEWLLYDWLMAHRESPASGAIDLHDRGADARLIVAATAALARARTRTDVGLLDVPTRRG